MLDSVKYMQYNMKHFEEENYMSKKVDPADLVVFEESLEDGDWGLIFGPNGELKGLFIPQGKEEHMVPESIIKICQTFYGVDLTDDDNTNPTLH
tara:strand:- start:3938 stop:4219 length:282 start_codon:yes stop_codon:yes gene_type:complete